MFVKKQHILAKIQIFFKQILGVSFLNYLKKKILKTRHSSIQ